MSQNIKPAGDFDMKTLLKHLSFCWILISILLYPVSLFGQNNVKSEDKELEAKQAMEAEQLQEASSKTIRQFHEVLDELLAEFGYDVKTGQMKGLQNLAIRKVDVSSALPDTYKEYTKLLVSERIRENSQTRLISCISCSTKTSQLVEGKIMITSPSTNLGMLKAVANQMGIDNFMDVVLVYHTTHMVLAFQIFNVETNELVWARTYNSETIKSRYQKLAIDYSQVAKSRPGEDYVPEYRFMFGLGGSGLPNVAGDTSDASMIGFHFRASEKFNNRKSEFGLLLIAYKSLNSLLKDYPTTGPETTTATDEPDVATPKPFETAFSFYGLYGHNFLGSIESYNNIRHGVHAGIGAFLASGYITGSAKLGWDMFFGRSFTTTISTSYIAPSHILVNSEKVATKGGIGADVVLSYNY